jgi:hypothetical protein
MPEEQLLRIYIPDATYGREDWEEESPKFRQRLIKEYQLPFEETDIGTGAGEPGLVTALIDSWPVVLAAGLFFNGKRIKENLDAWIDVFQRLKPFFKNQATFDRDGAAVLAIDGIRSALGKLPTSVRLVGYQTDSLLNQPFEDAAADKGTINGIDPALDYVRRATIHIMQIEADGRMFKVFVRGSNVVTIELNDV